VDDYPFRPDVNLEQNFETKVNISISKLVSKYKFGKKSSN